MAASDDAIQAFVLDAAKIDDEPLSVLNAMEQACDNLIFEGGKRMVSKVVSPLQNERGQWYREEFATFGNLLKLQRALLAKIKEIDPKAPAKRFAKLAEP